MLEFKRTGSGDYPGHLKMLAMAPPKGGKTSLLATVPNIVIADVEHEQGGLQSIAHLDVPYVAIDSSQTLNSLRMVLKDDTLRAKAAQQLGMEKIEAVGLDTVSAYQKLLKAERMRAERKSSFTRDDWGWLLDEMRQTVESLVSLPLHVIITCHTRLLELDEGKVIHAPLLQGQIGDDLPGMVGYSVIIQREHRMDEQGNPHTEYFLQTEGDAKHPFLGNRTAGRLPKFVEPDFQTVSKYAMAGLEELAETRSMQMDAPSEPAEMVAAKAGAPSGAGPVDDADQPVSKQAMDHLERFYGEFDLVVPPWADDWTIGKAREIAKWFVACKSDHASGKLEDPKPAIVEFLKGNDAFVDPADPRLNERVPDGSVADVLEWVDAAKGTDAHQVRARAALRVEREGKSRKTLVEPLEGLLQDGGEQEAPEPTPEPDAPQGAPEAPEPEPTPEPEPEPEPEAEPEAEVQPSVPAPTDDVPTVQQAGEALKTELGATEVASPRQHPADAQAPDTCERCQGAIDDEDLAELAHDRFDKWLCVSCYLAVKNEK